jgi:hypothetical protein
MTTEQTKLALVRNIKDAPKKKADDVAPLEAFEPGAVRIQANADDWQITACDGEQTYIYVASRKKGAKTYGVTEVYPGFARKKTAAREVTEQKDLLLVGRYPEISDVLEEISDALFGEFEEEPGEEGAAS